MAYDETTSERLIGLFAFRPRYIINGQITIAESAAVTSIERKTDPSGSLGILDTLPLELLHAIFAMLDFKTLSHIQKTCLRGISVIESLREYRDMIEHAPKALAALGRTRLIHYHSATALHAALLSADCQSCGEYGPFLHLPTCKRCCYQCLWKHPRLWVIPISQVKSCFGITNNQLKRLPVMRSIPGRYSVRNSVSRRQRIRLLCVETAKRLAIEENGDDEWMDSELESKYTNALLSSKDYHNYKWLQAAPLQSPNPGFAARSLNRCRTSDEFCGMASLPFPYLTVTNAINEGYWCLGCELTYRQWSSGKLNIGDVSHLISPRSTRLVDDQLRELAQRARSSAGLLEHLPRCIRGRSLDEMEPELRGWAEI